MRRNRSSKWVRGATAAEAMRIATPLQKNNRADARAAEYVQEQPQPPAPRGYGLPRAAYGAWASARTPHRS